MFVLQHLSSNDDNWIFGTDMRRSLLISDSLLISADTWLSAPISRDFSPTIANFWLLTRHQEWNPHQ